MEKLPRKECRERTRKFCVETCKASKGCDVFSLSQHTTGYHTGREISYDHGVGAFAEGID